MNEEPKITASFVYHDGPILKDYEKHIEALQLWGRNLQQQLDAALRGERLVVKAIIPGETNASSASQPHPAGDVVRELGEARKNIELSDADKRLIARMLEPHENLHDAINKEIDQQLQAATLRADAAKAENIDISAKLDAAKGACAEFKHEIKKRFLRLEVNHCCCWCGKIINLDGKPKDRHHDFCIFNEHDEYKHDRQSTALLTELEALRLDVRHLQNFRDGVGAILNNWVHHARHEESIRAIDAEYGKLDGSQTYSEIGEEKLEAELEALRRRVGELEAKLSEATNYAQCAYCRAKMPKDTLLMIKHLEHCEDHPIRKIAALETTIAGLTTQRDNALAKMDQIAKYKDELYDLCQTQAAELDKLRHPK